VPKGLGSRGPGWRGYDGWRERRDRSGATVLILWKVEECRQAPHLGSRRGTEPSVDLQRVRQSLRRDHRGGRGRRRRPFEVGRPETAPLRRIATPPGPADLSRHRSLCTGATHLAAGSGKGTNAESHLNLSVCVELRPLIGPIAIPTFAPSPGISGLRENRSLTPGR
jgi:hypothetical protein